MVIQSLILERSKHRPLAQMEHADKDRIILHQWDKIDQLVAENARLKKELDKHTRKLRKTSKNSSLPPSSDQKASVKEEPKPRHHHHHQGGKPLHPHPDISISLTTCPDCQGHLEHLQLVNLYDKYDLPEVKPLVTQVSQYQGHCSTCQKQVVSQAPPHLAVGSPFGASIQKLATYYRYEQLMSYERLSRLFVDVYHLNISEGGLKNLFERLHQTLRPAVEKITERVRNSRWIASDETSSRVKGKTQWEWVFQNEEVCLHVIRPSRGSQVKDEVLDGHTPEVWVSDLYSAQRNHDSAKWQVCLSHQLRDLQYGMDAGDDIFSPLMYAWIQEALHARDLSLEEKKQKFMELKDKLTSLLLLKPTTEDGIRLNNRYWGLQDNLLLFLEDESIPATNNASEQALRMSVIFRKVTNGFRSEWGKEMFAAIRSVINTGKRQGLSSFEAIGQALVPT